MQSAGGRWSRRKAAGEPDEVPDLEGHDDRADEVARALDRVRALFDTEGITASWDPGQLVARDTSKWPERARSWQVAPDALVISDGEPDLSNAQVLIEGAGSALVIASDVVLRGARIEMRSAGSLVFIGPRSRLNLVVLSVTGHNGAVLVGADATWQSGSCLCQREGRYVIVGDDCMLADEVLIRTNDGHGIFDRSTREPINSARSVVLESHVWIGRRSTVNKGARVATGSVVGGDSVVSGSLDAHSLYAGVPVKKLRDGVTWSRTHEWDDIPEAYR